MKIQFPRFVLGFCLILCPAISFGQAVFGSISGTIIDQSGAAVSGAKVTITETGKGVSYTTVTNVTVMSAGCTSWFQVSKRQASPRQANSPRMFTGPRLMAPTGVAFPSNWMEPTIASPFWVSR